MVDGFTYQKRSPYIRVLLPSLIVVGLVALMAISSVTVLSGVRGYVGGESLWSKARNEAVLHLTDYAFTRDELDYQRFVAALAVPLGDQRARIEMMKPSPDHSTIQWGLITGGIHPDDIDVMIMLFRRFGTSFVFKDALQAWTQGDALIDQLRKEGAHLHQQILSGEHEGQVAPTVQTIRQISAALAQQEKRFSSSLASAARITEQVLIGGVAISALLLWTLAYWLMHHSVRKQQIQGHALAQATERWELAAQVAQLGVFELNMDNHVIKLDARSAQLHGLPHQALSLPRQDLRRHLHPDDVAPAIHQAKQALRQNQSFRIHYRIPQPDGSERHIEAMGSMAHAKDAGPAKTSPGKVVGVFRDVTDEYHRQELATQRDAAERIAQAQREFLARLSHELRTPLNAILGFAQLLQMDVERRLSATQAEQVDWIFEAGQQLLRLVEDVLDLTKVEAGEIQVHMRRTDVCDIIRKSLVLVENAGKQHQVALLENLPLVPVFAWADPQRLQQVLVNLLTNACKYNRPGGHVLVYVEQDGHGVAIAVQDNGYGLTPTDSERLFQPFKRASHPSNSQVEGTGLGLYIARQLLQHMKGEIQLSSTPGEGSTFTVRLPPVPSVQSVSQGASSSPDS